ncbi:MAG TPA: S9 family peptidase [Thermoanaerobaculia bacterium]|nr:S9 family peptidase [Thermoanaerobaculia bacterium]
MRMKLLAVALASLSFVFARSPEERAITDPQSITSARNDRARPVPIEDLFFTRAISSGAWSPDGKEIVFTTNLTGRLNLWKVDAAGGWPVQLAVSDDRQARGMWTPDGKWILWQQDRGGNEQWDIYAIPAAGGAPVNITSTPDVSESDAAISPDSTRLAIDYKPKTASVTDVAVLDLATRAVRNLTNDKSADRTWTVVAWSPDGKTLYANRQNPDETVGEVWRIDAATGALENLTPHVKTVSATAEALSPDGRTLLVTSNEKGGYDNVALLDVASKKLTWITDLKWEAKGADFSPDGKWIAYTVNEDGQNDVFLKPVAGGAAQRVELPRGLNSAVGSTGAFSPQSDRLLVGHQSSITPNDYWIYDLKTRKPMQLSRSALASLDAAALPQAQIVTYKSFDGTLISALLWVPFNLERNGKNPGIVLPHGGPTGQTIDNFNRNAAALVSRGYTLIAPNVRGSSGYGMAFQKMNYQDLGGADLQDEVYAAKFLSATGYVDPKKIGMAGGSYGGFMTLMAIGKTPDVWAAAVDLFGIVDWYTMLQHEDPRLQEYEKSLLGDPVKDRAVYENTSPIKHLVNAKAPLLVLQGENDIRVPKEESEQVVSILQKAGKTVDAHYYPAEGHGFQKRENQIDSVRRMVEWFEKYLK